MQITAISRSVGFSQSHSSRECCLNCRAADMKSIILLLSLLLHFVGGLEFPPQFLDPNHEVYREIYEDSLHGRIPLEESSNIQPDPDIQRMYTQLFQTAPNRQQGSLLDSCPPHSTPSSTNPLPPSTFFFSMNHDHLEAVHQIKSSLMKEPSSYSMICAANRLRGSTNRHAWVRGVVAAAMSRDDTAYLSNPPLSEVLPSLQIPGPVIQQARRSANGAQCRAMVDGSLGVVNGQENALWYFREDMAINSNHWFWHLSNPFSHARLEVPRSPRPDRRGELFYYFHRGILARYHAERLGNRMGAVQPLNLERGTVLKEQYYSFLTDANSARNWTERGANTRLQDLVSNRDFISHPANISISERLVYLRRIQESIKNGALIDRSGRPITLDPTSGIDLLSEAIEASIYSINPEYYSEFGVHNDGHFLIGLVADPDDVLQIPPSVMADGATAMRDPVFYTYHTPIDELFEEHKLKLEGYTPRGGDWPLEWPSVEITSLHVQQPGQSPNDLLTYFNERKVNLVRGLDFNRSDSNGSVHACVKHLDYEAFEYVISVNSKSKQLATVRIFLAPRYDLAKRRYSMKEQRKLFFPLDHYTTELAQGANLLKRRSSDSNLIIPWAQPFEELERDSSRRLTPYCGCGWPEHMLLPRGNEEGQVFDLFVMLTDSVLDRVQTTTLRGRSLTHPGCRPAFVYCGVANQPYPDARPMNYPFDRGVYKAQGPSGYYGSYNRQQRLVSNLDEYTFGIPNIGTVQISIRNNGRGNGAGGHGFEGGRPPFGGGGTHFGGDHFGSGFGDFGGGNFGSGYNFGGGNGGSGFRNPGSSTNFGSGFPGFGGFGGGSGFGGHPHFGSGSSSSSSSSTSFGSYGR